MYYKDINLLPNKNTKFSFTRILIYVLALFAVGSYVMIYLVDAPLREKNRLEEEYNEINQKISSFGNVSSEYLDTVKKNLEYTERSKELKKVLAYEYKPSVIIKTITGYCPSGVIVTGFSFKKNQIAVEAIARDYESIGTYIDSLQMDERIAKVIYSNIHFERNKAVMVPGDSDPNMKTEERVDVYAFSLTINMRGE